MPRIIQTPFLPADFADPTLQQVNQWKQSIEGAVNSLGGYAGPVSIQNDLGLNGNSITDSPSISVTKSVPTGTIGASGSAQVTCVWDTPFGDAQSYVPSVSILNSSTTTSGLYLHHIISVTSKQVVVLVVNGDSANSHVGTVFFTAKVQE